MTRKKIIVISSIIAVLAATYLIVDYNRKHMGPKKKILMVIAPVNFRDAEYFTPKKIIEDAGFEVKTASIQSGTSRGADGGEARIELTASDANPADYEAVAFIGGPGMKDIVGDESLQVLAVKFNNTKKIVAAICVAPSILARAGVLKGIKATAYPDAKADLEKYEAIYQDKPLVISGNFITANGPDAAQSFGEAIVSALR